MGAHLAMPDKPSLLIVDNSEDDRVFCEKMMDSYDVEVRIVSNGKDALKELIGRRFDYALVDIILQDESGADVAQDLMNTQRVGKIFYMSAMSLESMKDFHGWIDPASFINKMEFSQKMDSLFKEYEKKESS